MSGEKVRQLVDAVASHPKTATVVVTGMANFNVWFADYEPIAKFVTSILGIILVSVLIVKHALDIKKDLSKKD
jgi:hypothetical protein